MIDEAGVSLDDYEEEVEDFFWRLFGVRADEFDIDDDIVLYDFAFNGSGFEMRNNNFQSEAEFNEGVQEWGCWFLDKIEEIYGFKPSGLRDSLLETIVRVRAGRHVAPVMQLTSSYLH